MCLLVPQINVTGVNMNNRSFKLCFIAMMWPLTFDTSALWPFPWAGKWIASDFITRCQRTEAPPLHSTIVCLCAGPPESSEGGDRRDLAHRFGSHCRGHHDQQTWGGFGDQGPGWTHGGGGSSGGAEGEGPLRREGGWSELRHQLQENRNMDWWHLRISAFRSPRHTRPFKGLGSRRYVLIFQSTISSMKIH